MKKLLEVCYESARCSKVYVKMDVNTLAFPYAHWVLSGEEPCGRPSALEAVLGVGLQDGINLLKRRAITAPFLRSPPCEDTLRGPLSTHQSFFAGAPLCWYPDLASPVFQPLKQNKFLPWKPPRPWYFVMASQTDQCTEQGEGEKNLQSVVRRIPPCHIAGLSAMCSSNFQWAQKQ